MGGAWEIRTMAGSAVGFGASIGAAAAPALVRGAWSSARGLCPHFMNGAC